MDDHIVAEVRRLLGPAATLLTDADMQASIVRATIDGQTDTWLAAAEAADLLGIRAQGEGGLVEVSSEGTTLKRSTADFFAMAAALRAKSTANTKASGVGVVHIDTGDTEWLPTSMAGDGYLEWDGDMPRWHPWRSPDLP